MELREKPGPLYEGVDDSFPDQLRVLAKQNDWQLRHEDAGIYWLAEHSGVILDEEDGDTLRVRLWSLEKQQESTISELCERLGGKKWSPPPLTPAQKRRRLVHRVVGTGSVIAIVGFGYFYGMWWVLPRMFAGFLLLGFASELWDRLEKN